MRAVVRPPEADAFQLLLRRQRRAVQDIAVALPELFHRLRKRTFDRAAEIVQNGKQADFCLCFKFPVGASFYFGRKPDLGHFDIFCNYLLITAVFLRNLSVLRQQRIVIVGSHVRRQLVIII